jgi:PAS domain S-box-containing protein
MTIRVLLVEDDPGDARLIAEVLGAADALQCQTECAVCIEDALVRLSQTFEVVLLDLGLPDSQGLSTVARMVAAAPDTPILVLTVCEDEELAREALRAGAQDYLLKNRIESNLLARAIRYAIERKQREVEQRRAEEELRLLRSLVLTLGEAEELDTALTLVLQQLCRVTGWDVGEVWLPDSKTGVLRRGPTHSSRPDELERFLAKSAEFTFTPGSGLIGRVWQSREPAWIEDLAADRVEFDRAELAIESGLCAAVAIPVLTREEVVAVLAFYHTRCQSADERMVQLVSTAAKQLGALIRRRRSEDALSAERKLQEVLLQNLPGPAWVKDADGRYQAVNEAFAAVYGLPAGSIVGKSDLELWPIPLAEFFRATDQDARSLGGKVVREEAVPGADGRVRQYEVSKIPFRDAAGVFAGTVGIAHDITQRRRSAERVTNLWRIARELSGAISPHQVAAVAVRNATETLGAESACLAILLENGRFVQVLDSEGVPDEVLEAWRRSDIDGSTPLARASRTRKAAWIEAVGEFWREYPGFAAALAGEVPPALAAIPLIVEDRVLGALALGFSTEQEWTVEDRLYLHQFADQCAQALERARLYDAERDARGRAEAAIRERDEVLGVVAHDLRNPLYAIGMIAYMLRDPELPDEKRQERVDSLVRSAEQMDQLIADLLDVARLEAGKLGLEPEYLAPARLVADACERMAPLAAEKQIELRSETEPRLPRVSADARRVMQVFSNLIGNAIKFTPPGGLIVVGAASSEDRVRFHVNDTGPGIPAENLPFLFDRFWKAKKQETGGAGLGLAIARGIVEAHGGWISVDSRLGSGSTFSFTLPTVATPWAESSSA